MSEFNSDIPDQWIIPPLVFRKVVDNRFEFWAPLVTDRCGPVPFGVGEWITWASTRHGKVHCPEHYHGIPCLPRPPIEVRFTEGLYNYCEFSAERIQSLFWQLCEAIQKTNQSADAAKFSIVVVGTESSAVSTRSGFVVYATAVREEAIEYNGRQFNGLWMVLDKPFNVSEMLEHLNYFLIENAMELYKARLRSRDDDNQALSVAQ